MMYCEYSKNKKSLILIILVFLIIISLCACDTSVFVENTDTANESVFNTQRCTVNGVTFYVNKNWKALDGKEGIFEIKNKQEYFQLNGVSELNNYKPIKYYELLLEQYDNNYSVVSHSEELEKKTLSDGTNVYLASQVLCQIC